MTRAHFSPFLDPQLDAPQSAVLDTYQQTGAVSDRAGPPINPNSACKPATGFSLFLPVPGSANPSHGTGCKSDRVSFPNRAVSPPTAPSGLRSAPGDTDCAQILNGFASAIRLQADGYAQSVFFALLCMLVPTMIAVIAAAYAVSRNQIFY